METFLVTVGTMAIGGIAWVAYKHPTSYSRLYGSYLKLHMALTLAYFACLAGINFTRDSLVEKFSLNADAATAHTEAATRIMSYCALGATLFLAFCTLLVFLPNMIDLDEGKRK